MAREPGTPPEEFVAFVERRGTGLRLAAHVVTGNDRVAESLVRDLLAATALRWRRLTRVTDPPGRPGADAYLDRIFLREAASWRADRNEPAAPRADLRLLRQDSASPAAARLPDVPAAELARLAWGSAQRTRRRWSFVAAGVAVLAILAILAPRGAPPAPADAGSPPALEAPGTLPEWIDVLPTLQNQASLPTVDTPLPDEILLTGGLALSTHRIDRALLLLLPADGPPLVLGPDGGMRALDGLTFPVREPGRLGSTPITPASLSRDGRRAAFITSDGIAVVEFATATTRRFSVNGRLTDLVWLDLGTLLVAGPRTARLIDVRTGNVVLTTVDARYALTRQGPAAPVPSPTATGTVMGLPGGLVEQVVELLPSGEPATAPARIRRYTLTGADAATPVVTPIAGDRTSWVGQWIGPGFLNGDLAARDCDARELMISMPGGRPAAINATVVVDARTGVVRRALAAGYDATRRPDAKLLGWLDRDTILIVTTSGTDVRLISWRITDGELRRVAEIDGTTLVSVADFTPAP